MCEHKECEHSLGPGSHCVECDRLKLLDQMILSMAAVAPEPKWNEEVNGQTDDGLQIWINNGRYEDNA